MISPPRKRKLKGRVIGNENIEQDDLAKHHDVEDVIHCTYIPQRFELPKNASEVKNKPIVTMEVPLQKGSNGENEGNQAKKTGKKKALVMKYMDFSLDLSKYPENTPLYPLCRAWMANQPRNPNIGKYLDERPPSPDKLEYNSAEILLQLRAGELKEVHVMPKPLKAEIPKIPVFNKSKTMKDSRDLIKLNEEFKDVTKMNLLAEHLTKWKQVKKDWITHTKKYQERYQLNFMIIEELFKP